MASPSPLLPLDLTAARASRAPGMHFAHEVLVAMAIGAALLGTLLVHACTS